MLNMIKSAALAAVVGSMGLASQASAYDRRIDLVNHSSQAITSFYASNVGARTWQEDVLGRSVVQPGERVRINLNDGTGYCLFDFRTVTANGEEIVRRGVNVCEVSRYTLTDG